MENEIRITEHGIRAKATQKSFERGVDYFKRGMVDRVTQRGCRIFSEVQGSECEPYHVVVALQARDFTATCTCLYDWGGHCKHIVATLLAFTRNNEDVVRRPPIEDTLSKLNKTALKTLIMQMVERDPSTADIIDSFHTQI